MQEWCADVSLQMGGRSSGHWLCSRRWEKKDIPNSPIPEWLGSPCTVFPDRWRCAFSISEWPGQHKQYKDYIQNALTSNKKNEKDDERELRQNLYPK